MTELDVEQPLNTTKVQLNHECTVIVPFSTSL